MGRVLGLALGDGRHVFLSNRVANTISQIDYTTLKVVRTLPGPGADSEPSG